MRPGDLARSIIAAGGAPPPADGQDFASGIILPNLSPEPPRGGPSRPPVAADEAELDDLRQRDLSASGRPTRGWYREALFRFQSESTRLAALQQHRERARAERCGEQQALAEAEAALKHARQFGRAHLAYVNQEEIGGPSPANAAVERDMRRPAGARPRDRGGP